MTYEAETTDKMKLSQRVYPLGRILAGIGRLTISLVRPVVDLSAMTTAVVWQSGRPWNRRRTLAMEFFRQFRIIGFGALSFILVSGVLIGLAMVFQFVYWLALAGQRAFLGKIIVLVMVREVAPLLVALIIIGRSGSVNMMEFGAMRSGGQLRMLEALGIDPFLFLILPRSLATAVSMFCLTILLILTALATGYLAGRIMAPVGTTPLEFANQVLAAMGLAEYAIIALKPIIAGLLITLITCREGLFEGDRAGRTAEILPIGFVKSVFAVFFVSGALSVLL